ncbi:hypothetical protein RQP46_010950 [Phenoliferia psychrophenolica]
MVAFTFPGAVLFSLLLSSAFAIPTESSDSLIKRSDSTSPSVQERSSDGNVLEVLVEDLLGGESSSGVNTGSGGLARPKAWKRDSLLEDLLDGGGSSVNTGSGTLARPRPWKRDTENKRMEKRSSKK